MSWWISLRNKEDEIFQVESFEDGGTRCLGGSTEADLNVTYNYSEVTHLVDFNFQKSLNGKTAAETVPVLEAVVAKLGTHKFENYWAPTPGNAGHAANILLSWARQHPEGVWHVN